MKNSKEYQNTQEFLDFINSKMKNKVESLVREKYEKEVAKEALINLYAEMWARDFLENEKTRGVKDEKSDCGVNCSCNNNKCGTNTRDELYICDKKDIK